MIDAIVKDSSKTTKMLVQKSNYSKLFLLT